MKVKVAQQCLTLRPQGLYSPCNSPGQNTGEGSHSLLQGILPTQGSNPGLPHCRWILYQLSHKGSTPILEWVVYPFSRRSSRPRNRVRVSCIAGHSLSTELWGKPLHCQGGDYAMYDLFCAVAYALEKNMCFAVLRLCILWKPIG